jgi:DEAD/DEAH box helicase domain-containing protein
VKFILKTLNDPTAAPTSLDITLNYLYNINMNTHNPKPNIVYFDLETQYSAADVGGWAYIDEMELALAVTYSTADREYATFFEADVDALIDKLREADLVVGFNIKSFDYLVLEPYISFSLEEELPTFDMLERIYRKLGFRVSLDNLAQATLGTAKSGDGLQSIEWWHDGKIDLVEAYCRTDVEITRELHEYACRTGDLLFTRSGSPQRVSTRNWASYMEFDS